MTCCDGRCTGICGDDSKRVVPKPAEMAYGLLWRLDLMPSAASKRAARELKSAIGKQGQKLGIAWAQEQFGEVSDAEIWKMKI